MSSCGIAAGAGVIFDLLKAEVAADFPEVAVRQCGCNGLCYAEPLVEVCVDGVPPVLYGRVTPDFARRIIEEHLGETAPHERPYLFHGRERNRCEHEENRCSYKGHLAHGRYHPRHPCRCLSTNCARPGSKVTVQAVRAADLGIYGAGVAVTILPDGPRYVNVDGPGYRPDRRSTLKQGIVLNDLVKSDEGDQMRIVLRNCGGIDPENIDDYLWPGGSRRLANACSR